MNLSHEWVTLGRIKGPHGIKGMVRVESYTEPSDKLLQYSSLYVHQNGSRSSLVSRGACERERNEVGLKRTRGQLIVSIPGCHTRDEALQFKEATLVMKRTDLPSLPEKQFYWSELIGLKVMTTEGEELGTVASLLPTGTHDVLVVKGKTEHLIPYVPHSVIVNVNLSEQTLLAEWDSHF